MRRGKVYYLDSNVFLLNKSIKDNILFGNDYKTDKYIQCIQLCELEGNLKEYENGDEFSLFFHFIFNKKQIINIFSCWNKWKSFEKRGQVYKITYLKKLIYFLI